MIPRRFSPNNIQDVIDRRQRSLTITGRDIAPSGWEPKVKSRVESAIIAIEGPPRGVAIRFTYSLRTALPFSSADKSAPKSTGLLQITQGIFWEGSGFS